MRAVFGFLGLVAWLPLGNLAEAAPDEDRLAVLAIVNPPGAVSQSEVRRAVAEAARWRTGLQLLTAEETFVANQNEVVDRVRDCGPDVPCIARRMRRFQARWGLVIVLDLSLSPAVLGLQLVDTEREQLRGQTLDELEDQTTSRARIVERTAELFERAGYVRAGQLWVTVDPPAAIVRLSSGDEPDAGSLTRFTLTPGMYEVRAEYQGFEAAQANVRVRSGAQTQVSLVLQERTSVWESPWLWVGVGVVVAAAVTAGAVVASRPEPEVCFSFPGRPCN